MAAFLPHAVPLAAGRTEVGPSLSPTHRSAESSLCGHAGIQAKPSGTYVFATADGVARQRPPSPSPSACARAVPATVTKPKNQRKSQ
jgi:hypothetical protein